MSEATTAQQKEKAAKIRRKSERESVLQHTFAAARHNPTSSSPWLESQQPGSGFLQRQCACGTHTIAGGECDSCRQKRESGSLQRTAADPERVEPGVESTIQKARGGRRSLADNVRTPMEQAFDADFSQVKVHTDTEAADEKSQPRSAYDFNRVSTFPVGLIQTQSGAPIIQRTLDVAAAIAYNQNALGGNTQFIGYIKGLLNRATSGSLPANGTIDEAFVRAVARFQEIRGLPRPYDGKIGSRTRRALATDLKGIFPGTGSSAAPRALRAVQKIIDIYTNEKILFAWWAGDCRDNNKNNRVDADDPSERDKGDGWPSPNRTFRGFRTISGTCHTPTGRTLTTTAFETDTPVKYKVCADIVSQAYSQAGVMSSTTRSVVSILRHFQTSRHCNVWQIGDPDFPDTYLPGDFICTAEGGHGHAGMIIHEESTNSGTQRPVVVHLPGSSLQIDRGEYDPTRTSDIRLERWPTERWLPSYLYLGRSRR